MSTEDKPVLSVYEGDYGLASLDIESLKSILYMAMADYPVEYRVLNNVQTCTFHSAPSLRDNKSQYKTFEKIVAHLRTLNYNIDYKLTGQQCSETSAIISLVSSSLKPVVEFVYWLDQRNCDSFTNLWFMRALPFPFNYHYIRRCKNEAVTLIETVYPTESDMDVVKQFLTSRATQCLADLATRLGTADYFFGDTPTTVDVVVYSHVAPLFKLPFPAKEIPNLLAMWPNLRHFVKRIDEKYFGTLSNGPKYLKAKENAPKSSDEDTSYLAAFVFMLSAVSLVFSFVYTKGIKQ